MKKIILGLSAILLLASFYKVKSLKGKWEYCGGNTNGKSEGAPTDYKLQRVYSANKFEAFLIEKGSKPEKYQAGDYKLVGDTCMETETYSAQTSTLTGKTLQYLYTIDQDTLKLIGTLPNGATVAEYWKKVK
jgi:hypothetical protein